MNHSPDIGLPVPSLGHEPFGHGPAGDVLQPADVSFLEPGHQAAVLAAAKFMNGREINAGVVIDEIPVVGGEADVVGSVARSEANESGPVEIDAAVMDVVGVLLRIHAAGAEPDLLLFGIDAVHPAHHPFSPGDLVDQFSARGVEEIEVIPAVSLRHPDDLTTVIEVVMKEFLEVVEKGFGRILDQGSGFAGPGVHRHDAHDLVSALIVEEGEVGRIGGPAQVPDAPRIVEEAVIERQLLLRFQVAEDKPGLCNPVSGFGVAPRLEPGLHPVGRR